MSDEVLIKIGSYTVAFFVIAAVIGLIYFFTWLSIWRNERRIKRMEEQYKRKAPR